MHSLNGLSSEQLELPIDADVVLRSVGFFANYSVADYLTIFHHANIRDYGQ